MTEPFARGRRPVLVRGLIAATAAIVALTLSAGAEAQQAQAPAQQLKTIGQAKPEMVPSLIVMNAGGATLDGSILTLRDVASNSIVFADRPVRAAGHAPTSVLLDEWNPSYPDGFAADPPNATVSAFGDGEAIRDAVVVLKAPRMQGADLVFDVDVLDGSLDGAGGPAAVFIDIIGRPLTPLSFAGAARRTAYRSAWYAGAAAGAYDRPACGYPPYPPCY